MIPMRESQVRIEASQAAMEERQIKHEEKDDTAFRNIDASFVALRLDLMTALNNGLHSINQSLAGAMADIDSFKQDKIRADERARTIKELSDAADKAEKEEESRANIAAEKRDRWRVPIIAALTTALIGSIATLGGGWFVERHNNHAHEVRVTTSTTTTAEHPISGAAK